MAKMMGRAKHMGCWYIDKWDDNRAARTREHRMWSREAKAESLSLVQDHDDEDAA